MPSAFICINKKTMSKDIRELIDKIKNFKGFLNENDSVDIWYRGYTTNTKDNEYVWITSSEQLAKQYAEINKYTYLGNPLVDKFQFNDNKFNLYNLYSYDMDDMINENDVNIKYDYVSLFDIMEDEIPLSRLVNNILSQLVKDNDGFKIMENNIKTIYIKTRLLK